MDTYRHPIPLYPHPPVPHHQTHDDSQSDEHSDFPPIREHKSTPDPPAPLVSSRLRPRSPAIRRNSEQCSLLNEEPQPSQLRRSRPPNRGLGHKNMTNTPIASPRRHAKVSHQPSSTDSYWYDYQGVSKSSLKRNLETIDVADDPPLKRKCLTFIDEDDMDWLKDEISGIKECIKGITNHLRQDVDIKLEELLHEVRQKLS